MISDELTQMQRIDSAVVEWREICGDIGDELRRAVSAMIEERKAELADLFYATMTGDAEAAPFLGHQLINERLRFSLQKWLSSLFRVDDHLDPLEIINQQKEIGAVHARVHVPIHVVNRGARLLKRAIAQRAAASDFATTDLIRINLYVNDLIDLAIEIASSAYVVNTARNVRTDEAYRLFSLSQNISVERERQRAALLEWGHQLLFALYGDRTAALPKIGTSAFGMWLHHKANVVFEGAPEIERIGISMNRIDHELIMRLDSARASDATASIVSEVERSLLEIKYLLTTLFDRYLEIENARDVLTRLLNRRFLPSVLSREILIAKQRNTGFCVLLIDIDHFKRINDSHGHEAGDLVLQQAADLITGTVRSGDFVFRYGGEEILIVLVEVDKMAALNIAESIRRHFAGHPFKIGDQQAIDVTVSIGIAAFDGHPDHDHLIGLADEALYRAKERGRNCCVASFE